MTYSNDNNNKINRIFLLIIAITIGIFIIGWQNVKAENEDQAFLNSLFAKDNFYNIYNTQVVVSQPNFQSTSFSAHAGRKRYTSSFDTFETFIPNQNGVYVCAVNIGTSGIDLDTEASKLNGETADWWFLGGGNSVIVWENPLEGQRNVQLIFDGYTSLYSYYVCDFIPEIQASNFLYGEITGNTSWGTDYNSLFEEKYHRHSWFTHNYPHHVQGDPTHFLTFGGVMSVTDIPKTSITQLWSNLALDHFSFTSIPNARMSTWLIDMSKYSSSFTHNLGVVSDSQFWSNFERMFFGWSSHFKIWLNIPETSGGSGSSSYGTIELLSDYPTTIDLNDSYLNIFKYDICSYWHASTGGTHSGITDQRFTLYFENLTTGNIIDSRNLWGQLCDGPLVPIWFYSGWTYMDTGTKELAVWIYDDIENKVIAYTDDFQIIVDSPSLNIDLNWLGVPTNGSYISNLFFKEDELAEYGQIELFFDYDYCQETLNGTNTVWIMNKQFRYNRNYYGDDIVNYSYQTSNCSGTGSFLINLLDDFQNEIKLEWYLALHNSEAGNLVYTNLTDDYPLLRIDLLIEAWDPYPWISEEYDDDGFIAKIRNLVVDFQNWLLSIFPFNILNNFKNSWEQAKFEVLSLFTIKSVKAQTPDLNFIDIPKNGEGFKVINLTNFAGTGSPLVISLFSENEIKAFFGESLINFIRSFLSLALWITLFLYLWFRVKNFALNLPG